MHVQIAGKGDHHDTLPVRRDVHQHDRVGPGKALEFVRGTGADLAVRAGTGVGADDQVGLVAGLPARVDDVGGIFVQRGHLSESVVGCA